MNNAILFRSSINSLLHHKARSTLTILGIVIGIGSIIALMAIGKGAEEKIRRSILAAGKNFIYVSPQWPPETQHGKRRKLIQDLTYNNIKTLKKMCPGIEYISPTSYIGIKVKNQNVGEMDVSISGCNQDFIKIANRSIIKGIFIQPYHVQNASKVIVLGYEVAEQLFKNTNPIGKSIDVNKINFTVIGVVDKIDDPTASHNANKDCFAPVTTVKKHLKNSFDNVVNGIFIGAKDENSTQETIRQMTKILRSQHKLESTDPNDFTIFDSQGMLKAAQKASGTLSLFLLIVAFIALLIGGIGVMNIMLVCVGERTQEIGIRKALGATEKLIKRQFILEALTLCGVGGIVGIILGIIIPIITSNFTGWIIIITPFSILLATITIILVGIIFGYYPAQKAAAMSPIDSLSEK